MVAALDNTESIIFRVVGLTEEGGKLTTACELLPNYASTFDPDLDSAKLGETLMSMYTSNRIEYINHAGRIIKSLAVSAWQDELDMANVEARPAIEKKIAELGTLKFKLVSDAPEYISEAYFLSSIIIFTPSVVPVIQDVVEYTGILYTEDKVLTNRESVDES